METYWNHFTGHGLAFNVRTIIDRWAPPKENDTENYIRTVLLISGLGGMENLPQPSRKVDEERLIRLIGAMTCVECGIRYKEVDWNAIRKGYELAFPGKRSYARTKPVPQESTINLTPDEIEDLLMWDEYRYWYFFNSPRSNTEFHGVIKFYSNECHSKKQSDEDELLRTCPKNLEYIHLCFHCLVFSRSFASLWMTVYT